MRRADRLFQIVQRLRRRQGATTAAQLAGMLGVSNRTIYRDVQDLILSGVPVVGEAGVGYALGRGYDLPPLMFTEEEIEAIAFGARVVQTWSDPGLKRAAQHALEKIESAVTQALRDRIADATLFAPPCQVRDELTAGLGALRSAVKEGRKVRFRYSDLRGAPSERTVQPLGLFYWGAAWSLAGWCELRADFRNFRVDRMSSLSVLDERFTPVPGRTLRDFFLSEESRK